MKTNFKQLNISDVFSDIQFTFEENKSKFIELFESFVDFSEIIPSSFYDLIIVIMVGQEIFLLSL